MQQGDSTSRDFLGSSDTDTRKDGDDVNRRNRGSRNKTYNYEVETSPKVADGKENMLQIINLSDYVFDRDETKVLQRGLTFSSMKYLDEFIVIKDVFYRQTSGTTMGARCAPSYANLVFGVVGGHTCVSPLYFFEDKVLTWARFIDDVIFVWKGSKEECVDFFTLLNENPFNIFLTSHISEMAVDFLDLTLRREGHKISTSLFWKPTATNLLLYFESFHPWHLRKKIPIGQFL